MNDANMQLISVVMPVYNAERFVAYAIESVLSQTYHKLELILIDDCSTDHSLSILQSYAEKDARIRIITNEENMGVAQTRNRGIQAASGAYIALLDSDDYWKATKLERQIHSMKAKDASISYCSVDMIDVNNRKIKTFSVPEKTDFNEMLVKCSFICSTVVVDAALLKAHPFKTEFYHEDYLLWLELLSLNVKTVGLTDVLAYYRQLAGSRSRIKVKSAVNRWLIYRKALKMGFFRSANIFIRYAFYGIRKYYL